MLKRVIVNGAHGKMGAMACETLNNHQEFELVAQLSRTDNLAKTIQDTQADIVVDLTSAECVYQNCLTIIQQGASPVVGTTGLMDKELAELKALCTHKQLGGIIAPNFSLSAVLMMNFAAQAAKFLPEVEIIESHHQQKLDAPSGTALKTADMIAKARQQDKNKLPLKELLPGARGSTYQEINIHSVRLPGVLAKQEVLFGNKGETLSICHNSLDRSCFMPGIILACQKVGTLDTLLYGLEHLLYT